ncbi:hypothetical protein EDD16DRAFT_1896205 [Pisolithus croceorrhizus]|nr:hypothetical protein EV401DRAFT_2076067 [Pisolithus croceorrhizus]KAI6117021.1 hypothetical protein EDD16DRAFT_1896205 [Pisolithus croceorrhizus]KAI6156262.1 hypothetical protein EDD17DRAFT_1055122 [Pisolithus thermaeus]
MPFLQNLRTSFKSAFTITSRVTEDDFVIFVVGPTGSGKSWFIRELLKSDDIRVAKSGQHPCTKNVQALRCNFNNGRNNIVVIDTPSFHTELEDFDAENEMTRWIKAKLTEKCRGSGVLFLHTLARDPTHYDMSITRHLTTFAMSFDGKFLVPSRVHVVATKDPASILTDEKMNQRWLQLRHMIGPLNAPSGKWKSSMFSEVFKGEPEQAWKVVQRLLDDISRDSDSSVA